MPIYGAEKSEQVISMGSSIRNAYGYQVVIGYFSLNCKELHTKWWHRDDLVPVMNDNRMTLKKSRVLIGYLLHKTQDHFTNEITFLSTFASFHCWDPLFTTWILMSVYFWDKNRASVPYGKQSEKSLVANHHIPKLPRLPLRIAKIIHHAYLWSNLSNWTH